MSACVCKLVIKASAPLSNCYCYITIILILLSISIIIPVPARAYSSPPRAFSRWTSWFLQPRLCTATALLRVRPCFVCSRQRRGSDDEPGRPVLVCVCMFVCVCVCVHHAGTYIPTGTWRHAYTHTWHRCIRTHIHAYIGGFVIPYIHAYIGGFVIRYLCAYAYASLYVNSAHLDSLRVRCLSCQEVLLVPFLLLYVCMYVCTHANCLFTCIFALIFTCTSVWKHAYTNTPITYIDMRGMHQYTCVPNIYTYECIYIYIYI